MLVFIIVPDAGGEVQAALRVGGEEVVRGCWGLGVDATSDEEVLDRDADAIVPFLWADSLRAVV